MSDTHEFSSAELAFHRRRAMTATSSRILAVYVAVGIFFLCAGVLASFFAKDLTQALYPFQDGSRYLAIRLGLLGLAFTGLLLVFAGLTSHYLRTGKINVFRSPDASVEDVEAPDIDDDGDKDVLDVDGRPRTPSEITNQLADELQLRIDAEIVAQNGKANINLIFGTCAALIAFIILVASIFIPPSSKLDDRAFGAIFASRIATSFTASVFAFFFLSTYRRNLSEIRYFHNEMTNIESKLLAFRMFNERQPSDQKQADAAYISILEGFSETERNFLLKKGETTTDISHRELDLREQAAWIAALSAVQKSPNLSDPKPRRGRNSAASSGEPLTK